MHNLIYLLPCVVLGAILDINVLSILKQYRIDSASHPAFWASDTSSPSYVIAGNDLKWPIKIYRLYASTSDLACGTTYLHAKYKGWSIRSHVTSNQAMAFGRHYSFKCSLSRPQSVFTDEAWKILLQFFTQHELAYPGKWMAWQADCPNNLEAQVSDGKVYCSKVQTGSTAPNAAATSVGSNVGDGTKDARLGMVSAYLAADSV